MVVIKCCKAKREKQENKLKEIKKNNSTSIKPEEIAIHASSKKVGSAVKNPRKPIFLCREPLLTPPEDGRVTHSLVCSTNHQLFFY